MSRGKRTVCALALALVPTAVLGGERDNTFTLGAYIPGDVWLYLHEVRNPERDFICAHWDKVFEAAARSGIDGDIRQLFAEKIRDPEQRSEFESKWDKVWHAISNVPWIDKLGRREFAMGQRIALPMPTYMFLFRNDPADHAAITASLVKLMRTIASTTDACAVVEDKRHGAKVWSLCIGNVGAVFEMFSRGDIIGAAVGKGALDDMLKLMNRKGTAGSIVADPAFQEALAEVDPPEDFLQYFRATQLFAQIQDCLNTALRKARGDPDVKMVRGVVFKAFEQFNAIDYSIWTRRTDGLQEVHSGITKLSPGAKAKPLVKALTERNMFKRFDRFVPENAAAFSVSTAIDVGLLYNTAIAFIRTEIPAEGPGWIAAWDGIQKGFGVDLNRDLFSWLSGEFVSVTLSGAMPGQKGGVTMIRTRDPKVAWEKVSTSLAWLGRRFEQLMVNPAPEVEVDGFVSVYHPMMVMMQIKPVVGMYEDWLVIGVKPRDVNRCLAVARGDAPSIRKNARFQAEGLSPNGPISGTSFSDWRKKGEELGMMFGMFGIVGGFLPPSEELRPVRTVFTLLARLAPVVAKIDFYSSQASTCRFTGDGWKHELVVTYKPPVVSAD